MIPLWLLEVFIKMFNIVGNQEIILFVKAFKKMLTTLEL